MALLQDLIQQIDDPALRERILQETNKLVKQKKFGLVFEEHLPECTPLYDVPIRVGSKVARKIGYVSDIYTVLKIEGSAVLCDRRETHEQVTLQMDEIVAIAEFGEPIYPTLKPIDYVENAPANDLWHTLIEADNYHALQLLEYVNPILIVQVLNGSGKKLTDTDLDDCLSKIEERTGVKFEAGQVVHTFGQTAANIQVNGLDVRYEEPSRIADDRNIRVVFFKENLSTGWDCPRAETMMSFKRANDATYIAQLLGRMIRTPMQMHIEVDDVLNDVHLYLPYFNEDTVKDIVEALQNSEGGEIPADIVGESTAGKKFDTLTVKSGKKGKSTPCPGQLTLDGLLHNPTQSDLNQVANPVSTETSDRPDSTMRVEPAIQNPKQELQKSNQAQPVSDAENQPNSETHIGNVTSFDSPSVTDNVPATMEGHASSASEPPTDLFDREAVMKFINDSGLLSYNVRSLRINNYLKSLYKMAHLLTMSRLRREAIREVQSEIADMIHTYVQDLKAKEKYEDLVLQVKQFKLATQIFDAFGETVDNYSVHDLFTTTDTDIDRQFRIADVKLGNEGIGMFYGNKYMDDADPSGFKVDVILFAADGECMIKLYQYAETRFHRMNDDYRRYFATITSEDIRRQYDRVVSDGDVVSKHNFRLPETIQVPHESGGKEYRDHLFVSEETGFAKLKLNPWESGVLKEEQGRKDFVCWIRNPSRGSWALCIPYEMDGETKPTYPDIIIVRTDKVLGYVIDILEPHNPAYKDNLGKAKGFAEYARQNPGVGRIQLIRMSEDAAKNKRFKRLDMSKSAIRDKVSHAMSNDELDHIFDTDGFFADSIED